MHYLVTPPPVVVGGGGDKAAAGGEPVVPWFPAPLKNSFLSVASWTLADFAIVADIDLDLDTLAQRLHAQYPGLPRVLHDNYVLATAVAASQLPVGARVRPILDYNFAQVQVVNTATVLTLWEAQPTKEPL